jgi:SNF2 family DNA or RNA helicase
MIVNGVRVVIKLGADELGKDQLDCIRFIKTGEDALVCADVGTGKTVIALTAIRDMFLTAVDDDDVEIPRELYVGRWLVLAPLLVADDVWRNEHKKWAHLGHLKIAIAVGDEAERIEAIESDAKIVVLNYENLTWLLKRYPIKRRTIGGKRTRESTLPFDGLVCDEVDKLKDVSSKRFKAFRDQVPFFKRRIGLTGTILPNHLLELWGQTFIIDAGETFGRSYYKFRQEYFYPTDYKQYKWAPFPNTHETLIDKLGDITYRLKAQGLPEVVYNEPARLELPASVRPLYRELHDELYLLLDDKKGGTREVDAANMAVRSGKLQQMCAGFSYVDRLVCEACNGAVAADDKGKQRCVMCNKLAKPEAIWHSHAKIDWLLDLLGVALHKQREQVLIFYHFVEELAELRRRLPNLRYLGGGVSRKNARESVKLWNEGRLPYLALHPASAGHGLNLQLGGAHRIAFLTLPWSGGMFKQVVGRLCRRGQAAERIYVDAALFKATIDLDVYATVTGKLGGLETFLDDLYEWQNGA